MIRDELAQFAAQLSFESIPAPVVTEVKRLLIDHVASMLAGPGVFAAELPNLPEFVRDQGGTDEASVIGVGGKYPCTAAAFSNTTMGFTGIDAWHKPSTLHVPAVLFSAAIAVAEREHATGSQLIEALVSGAEVMIRVSEALGPRNIYGRGFHPTSICGPFGCAIAAGCLLGLDEARLAEALSTAAVQSAGSSIWRGSRTPATFCVQIGRASQSGVLAALLAADGCYGVERIFEDPRGFPIAYAGESDPDKFTHELGTTFRIARLMMQQFWFGPYLLTSIESLIELLREHDLEPDAIEAIKVQIPTTLLSFIGAVEYPANRLAALTTLRYALAVVSHMGEDALYTPEVSAPHRMTNASVRALFERVEVEGDDELDRAFPGTEPSILEIRAGDGLVLTRRHDGPVRGDPDNPLSDRELVAKFDVMATPALPPGNRDKVLDTIRQLETLKDINDLTALWAS